MVLARLLEPDLPATKPVTVFQVKCVRWLGQPLLFYFDRVFINVLMRRSRDTMETHVTHQAR